MTCAFLQLLIKTEVVFKRSPDLASLFSMKLSKNPKNFLLLILLGFLLLLETFRSHWPFRISQPPKQIPHNGEPSGERDLPQTTPSANGGESASLLRVKGTKTLLVSAYLEHRTAEKEVRVIAITPRSEQAVFNCHLDCQRQLYVSKGVIKLNKDFFGYLYGTADVMCPLPPGCETPVHVAITLNGSKGEDHDFLEVKNQKAETESLPYNFTVCFPVMFEFTNVLQLVQSLEMLQLLGVNKAVIYKTSCSLEIQRVLDYYTSTGFVEVVPWSLSKYLNVSRGFMSHKDPGDIHYFGQMPALSDCLYRYMYQSRYMAFQDPDELILPQSEMQPKLRDDQLIYDGRLLNYSTDLSAAVNTVLKESRLLSGTK
ncbi:PREDICTED: uncharacterized protein LOC107097346 [Cyprinodon variegatus]|uniref:uncharacterized protein LOC107097346 n=1 Tax=Cyprinodon variegatus TaxID=28743 RepID=UPI0007427F25|nr:PREDICTED: uncharacterized protein LOC107097346 [Cyprinodon variegatus]